MCRASLGPIVPHSERAFLIRAADRDRGVHGDKRRREGYLVLLARDITFDKIIPVGVCDKSVGHLVIVRLPLSENFPGLSVLLESFKFVNVCENLLQILLEQS